jgi:hypothetical protein
MRLAGSSSAGLLCGRMMKNPIQFTDGSSIEWVDKETLRYSDGSHTVMVWVDFEPGFFSKGRIIKASSILKWDSCPSNEPAEISDETRSQIIGKVTDYYKRHKVPCRIEA